MEGHATLPRQVLRYCDRVMGDHNKQLEDRAREMLNSSPQPKHQIVVDRLIEDMAEKERVGLTFNRSVTESMADRWRALESLNARFLQDVVHMEDQIRDETSKADKQMASFIANRTHVLTLKSRIEQMAGLAMHICFYKTILDAKMQSLESSFLFLQKCTETMGFTHPAQIIDRYEALKAIFDEIFGEFEQRANVLNELHEQYNAMVEKTMQENMIKYNMMADMHQRLKYLKSESQEMERYIQSKLELSSTAAVILFKVKNSIFQIYARMMEYRGWDPSETDSLAQLTELETRMQITAAVVQAVHDDIMHDSFKKNLRSQQKKKMRRAQQMQKAGMSVGDESLPELSVYSTVTLMERTETKELDDELEDILEYLEDSAESTPNDVKEGRSKEGGRAELVEAEEEPKASLEQEMQVRETLAKFAAPGGSSSKGKSSELSLAQKASTNVLGRRRMSELESDLVVAHRRMSRHDPEAEPIPLRVPRKSMSQISLLASETGAESVSSGERTDQRFSKKVSKLSMSLVKNVTKMSMPAAKEEDDFTENANENKGRNRSGRTGEMMDSRDENRSHRQTEEIMDTCHDNQHNRQTREVMDIGDKSKSQRQTKKYHGSSAQNVGNKGEKSRGTFESSTKDLINFQSLLEKSETKMCSMPRLTGHRRVSTYDTRQSFIGDSHRDCIHGRRRRESLSKLQRGKGFESLETIIESGDQSEGNPSVVQVTPEHSEKNKAISSRSHAQSEVNSFSQISLNKPLSPTHGMGKDSDSDTQASFDFDTTGQSEEVEGGELLETMDLPRETSLEGSVVASPRDVLAGSRFHKSESPRTASKHRTNWDRVYIETMRSMFEKCKDANKSTFKRHESKKTQRANNKSSFSSSRYDALQKDIAENKQKNPEVKSRRDSFQTSASVPHTAQGTPGEKPGARGKKILTNSKVDEHRSIHLLTKQHTTAMKRLSLRQSAIRAGEKVDLNLHRKQESKTERTNGTINSNVQNKQENKLHCCIKLRTSRGDTTRKNIHATLAQSKSQPSITALQNQAPKTLVLKDATSPPKRAERPTTRSHGPMDKISLPELSQRGNGVGLSRTRPKAAPLASGRNSRRLLGEMCVARRRLRGNCLAVLAQVNLHSSRSQQPAAGWEEEEEE